MKRKGLGKGLGKGYKNIIPNYDSRVHSLSAKGIKSKRNILNAKKKKSAKKKKLSWKKIKDTTKGVRSRDDSVEIRWENKKGTNVIVREIYKGLEMHRHHIEKKRKKWGVAVYYPQRNAFFTFDKKLNKGLEWDLMYKKQAILIAKKLMKKLT
jgi:hypothetical protein